MKPKEYNHRRERVNQYVTVHTYGVTSNESGTFKVRLLRSAGFLTILLYWPIALQLVQGLGVNSNLNIAAAPHSLSLP